MIARKIAAIIAVVLVAVGLGIGTQTVTASDANGAVTFAGKICVRGDSTNGLYVRAYAGGPTYYLRQLDCSYQYIGDASGFYQTDRCQITVGNALYQGGIWQPLSNSLTVRTAYVNCY